MAEHPLTDLPTLISEMRQFHSEDVRWWASDLEVAMDDLSKRTQALIDAATWLVDHLPDPGGLIDPLLAALENMTSLADALAKVES